MHKVLSNKELDSIFTNRIGFVYNDYNPTAKNGSGRDVNKLHKAHTGCMDPENPNRLLVEGEDAKYAKYFFDTFIEAITWLKKERTEAGFSRCKICFPKSR